MNDLLPYVLLALLVASEARHYFANKHRDAREDRLLNRIQAPREAVHMEIEPSTDPQYLTESQEDERVLEKLGLE